MDGLSRDRLPFLDGIRAFAVCAVILYHFGVSGVTGGMLGVDVFFVLSGFLITALLCGEHFETGGIRLGRFWARRARRLLPGVFILLLGVALYAWFLRDSVDVSTIRADAIATILYVANWHFVFASQGYFAQGAAPSPLLHMWSLSVEEQYYLIWPGLVLLLLRWKGTSAVAWASGVGASCSALLMAAMFEAGISVNRLYYGTDTRAQALLVGSLLGAVAVRRDWRVVPEQMACRRAVKASGVALGTAGILVLLWAWHGWNGDGRQPLMYEGGFLLVAVAAGAVLVSVTSWRDAWLARFLALSPLVYLGRISYGLYLYHWPISLVLDGAHTGLSGPTLLVVRLAATLAAAVLSFHLVEQPIRNGGLARARKGLAVAFASAAATVAVVVAATVPPAFATVPAQGPTHISVTERHELAAAHAFTTDPVRFLLVGDSVAFTAARGLMIDSKPDYGVEVINGGALSCNLTRNPQLLAGVEWPETPAWQNCGSWPARCEQIVTTWKPEVVGLLIGRFELADSLYDGKWVHLGDPVWDAVLLGDLNEAIHILSSQGARVAVYTFPYIDPPQEQADGSPYPENLPSRVVLWNNLLRQAAADNPGTTLVDLNRVLDPDGHYTSEVDGYEVRTPDGIHLTTPGGEWLRPALLPQVAELGLQDRAQPGN
jgi:peptidoglycan/LPS O-acetylase OafA/YrhL